MPGGKASAGLCRPGVNPRKSQSLGARIWLQSEGARGQRGAECSEVWLLGAQRDLEGTSILSQEGAREVGQGLGRGMGWSRGMEALVIGASPA